MSDSPPDDPVLRVENLSVAYGGVRALDRLSLDVARDECLAVLGESGTGKTTLAAALVRGVPTPGRVSGDVTYYPRDGDPVGVLDLTDDSLRRFRRGTVAVVGGDALGGFDPTSSVRAEYRATVRSAGIRDGMDRARELLSTAGLDPDRVLDARPRELNSGARQLALVVRGLLTDPDVLVADDLPVAFGKLARGDRLDDLAGDATTVVALGSELPTLAALADRLAVLHDGHVVETGPTETLLEEPSHPHTRTLVEFYRGST